MSFFVQNSKWTWDLFSLNELMMLQATKCWMPCVVVRVGVAPWSRPLAPGRAALSWGELRGGDPITTSPSPQGNAHPEKRSLQWEYISRRGQPLLKPVSIEIVKEGHAWLNVEVDLQKFIWASCHVMFTAALIGWDPAYYKIKERY